MTQEIASLLHLSKSVEENHNRPQGSKNLVNNATLWRKLKRSNNCENVTYDEAQPCKASA